MAFLSISNVSLRGVAACVPKRIVENRDLPLFAKDEAEKVIATIGVERRRCVAEDDENCCTSDFCFHAANRLLEDLKWNASEIDVLILVTQTQDYRNPATACILQDRLGLPLNCIAFDVSLGCSGYIYGLTLISSMMQTGALKKGVLMVGDTLSLVSSPEDKSRAMLFGDAGTVTALEFDSAAKPMEFQLATDGSGYQAIITPHSAFRHRVTPESFIMEDFGNGIKRAPVHSVLDAMEVFSFGISRAPQSVKQMWEHYNINPDVIDYYLFHQANKFLNERIRKKLKLPPEKVPYNLKDFGNTSSASVPLLMVTNLREQLESRPTNLLCCAFGVGLSWGSVHLNLDRIVCPPLLEI